MPPRAESVLMGAVVENDVAEAGGLRRSDSWVICSPPLTPAPHFLRTHGLMAASENFTSTSVATTTGAPFSTMG